MCSENRKIKYKIILSWCLVILWAAVIFYFSSKNADDSTVQSQGMISSFSGIIGASINSYELMEKIDGIVRESAHAVEYFILGALVLNAVYLCLNYRKQEEMLLTAETGIECSDRFRILNAVILSVLVCVLYSLSDEIHQIPIDGRAFQLIDLFIDLAGTVAGVMAITVYYHFKKK